MSKVWIIGRHIGGVKENPLEFLHGADGEYRTFESEEQALEFLQNCGFEDDEIKEHATICELHIAIPNLRWVL